MSSKSEREMNGRRLSEQLLVNTNILPYGLAKSLSIFQDRLNSFVIAYIDNILINSNNATQHVEHVQQVLQRLADHHLYVKGEKCESHYMSIHFNFWVTTSGQKRWLWAQIRSGLSSSGLNIVL